eukprot:1103813-Prorocentrum_lima.AAC.2
MGDQARPGGGTKARRGAPISCGGKITCAWRSEREGRGSQIAGGPHGQGGGGQPEGTRRGGAAGGPTKEGHVTHVGRQRRARARTPRRGEGGRPPACAQAGSGSGRRTR